MRKRILVTGSARFWESDASRRARRLGSDLADLGFALTAGAEPGVDKAVAEGYVARARGKGLDVRELFVQLKEPFRSSVDRAKPAICRHFKTGHFR
jgi:predicted Rossmann-fold nucleotide-binding protein